MEDIGAYKASTIFVSQSFNVYEVDFFDSWYEFGWLQNRQSLNLDFFSILQKVGCSTQILTNLTMISCFKAILSFFFKKTISSNEFFGFFVSHWLNFWVHFPILIFLWFWIIYGCSMFWNVDLSSDVNLRTQHTFCWEGQKGCLVFYKKKVFSKKKKKERKHKKEKRNQSKFLK